MWGKTEERTEGKSTNLMGGGEETGLWGYAGAGDNGFSWNSIVDDEKLAFCWGEG